MIMARRSWVNSAAAAAVTVFAACFGGKPVSAHRLDEYLQAARIAINPGRVQVELDLTPGVAVAERVIRRIDIDGNGTLTPNEQERYARDVLSGVRLDVDGRSLVTRLASWRFPGASAMRSGDGTITLDLEAEFEATPGPHRLTFRNDNDRSIAAYLANALVPSSDSIAIHAQDRDVAQSSLSIAFTADASDVHAITGWLFGSGIGLVVLSVAAFRIRPSILRPLRAPVR
jgi:hypothetical protein